MIHPCKGTTPTSKEIYASLLKEKSMVPQDKGEVSLDTIKAAMKEFFASKTEDIDALKAKILSGYAYHITGDTIEMSTGSGGVLRFIEACAENHIPASLIEESISVWVNGQWNPLASATVTKLEKINE